MLFDAKNKLFKNQTIPNDVKKRIEARYASTDGKSESQIEALLKESGIVYPDTHRMSITDDQIMAFLLQKIQSEGGRRRKHTVRTRRNRRKHRKTRRHH
jgi:hypothetical protein